MPVRRYKKRTSKRAPKKYVRRGTKRTRRPMTKVLNGFPNNLTVRHRYVDHVFIPTTGIAFNTGAYAFRPNSMFDPNSTGAGHQPANRDDFAAIYSHYTVLSSKIKVTFPPSTVNYTGIVRYSEQLGSTSNPEEILESCELKRGNVQRLNLTGTSSKDAYAYFNAKRSICAGGNPVSDNRCFTASGSNPAATCGYILNACPHSYADIVPAVYVRVQIDYLCNWSGRIQQGLD